MVRYGRELWQAWGIPAKTLLELACGTGAAAMAFQRLGLRVVGVDRSEAMLAIALEKARARGLEMSFHRQDLRELALDERFDVATCFYDSLNYLLSPEELLTALRRVRVHVRAGGGFLFDLATDHALREAWGDALEVHEDEDLVRIWRTCYEAETRVGRLEATYFMGERDGTYRRIAETHLQRGYDPEEVQALLRAAGWELLAAYRCGTFVPGSARDYRVAYFARAV